MFKADELYNYTMISATAIYAQKMGKEEAYKIFDD